MHPQLRIGLVLVVCYLVAWLDRMAINIAMPLISTELEAGPEDMGRIMSAFFLGYALCQVPGGWLADRFGPRRVILGALAWWTVFTALTGLAPSTSALLVVRFLFGLGEGLFPAAVWKVLAQRFTTRNRATASSLVLSSIALGPALTPVVLVPLLGEVGWRASFVLLGAVGAVSWLLAWRFIDDAPEEKVLAERPRAPLREVVSSPLVQALFVVALAMNVTMYGWLNWLPVYLMKVKGLDWRGMAMASSVPFAFGAVGCMLAGWVSDRWFRARRHVLVLVCQVLGGACLFGFTVVDDVGAFMVLQCAAALLLFMSCGAIWAMPVSLLPVSWMGAGSGFINMGGQVGGFLTNLLIGFVVARAGDDYAAGFQVLFAGLIVSSLAMALGARAAAGPIAPT